MFNLERPPNRVRHGVDAVLTVAGIEVEFELKSVTTARGGLSTVRDLGKDHIEKWRNKHWIIAFYEGAKIQDCKYGSPDAMAFWVNKIWSSIKPDFDIAERVPPLLTLKAMESVIGKKSVYSLNDAKALHKAQYTASQYKNLMDMVDGYSPDRMLKIFRDRTEYLIERGSTLNNPHISLAFLQALPSLDKKEPAKSLRKLVRAWLNARPK